MRNRIRLPLFAPAALVISALMAGPTSAGLTFNFNPAPGTSQLAIDGFVAAGAMWSSRFADDITVNIDIGFAPLSPGVLANANTTRFFFEYETVRNSLIADAISDDDIISSSGIHVGQAKMVINGLFDTPFASYLDDNGNDNNNYMHVGSANLKALGLWSAHSGIRDGTITFNSDFGFDFDRSDGIAADSYDFIGLAAHEIGHTLGFLSGVDVLDAVFGFGYSDDELPYVTPLDLFRYSRLSSANGAIDWRAGTIDKYFSIDNGVTKIASFSTGYWEGDGQQASHWKDDRGLGLLDPSAARGELLAFSDNDLRALDVIGYDRIPAAAVPEPATLVSGVFAVFVALVARRGRAGRPSL
ncbi:MAG: NF038122 family metalloprotease [Isosphaeraceae bacterium]|nr:NF038122 family metalloprotease [Isosphaeraceae bacterium]